MRTLTLPELAQKLREGDNYVILTHRRPDGDTVGCAAALCRGLRSLGKRATVLENEQFTEKFRPYLCGLTDANVPENVCFVAVDVAAEEQFFDAAKCYVNQVTYLIDHHGSNSGYAAQGVVEGETAACAEIVLRLLLQLQVEITPQIAEALYVAISTDTGCFRFSNTTAETLRAAAFCKEHGADTFAINQVMFLTKRIARLKLESFLTETTEFYADGAVAVSAITPEIRSELGITEDDIDDISGFGREIAGVQIAVMLRQEGDSGKISVRTSPRFDASAICAALGGGGHRAAAGATVAGGIAAAKVAVLRAISDMGVVL